LHGDKEDKWVSVNCCVVNNVNLIN